MTSKFAPPKRLRSASSRARVWIAALALAWPATGLAQSASDYDSDTVANGSDNCPFAANLDQADGGGVQSSSPDGVGDACQCGDVNASARIDLIDVVVFRRHLASLGPGIGDASRCSVAGSALDCDAGDVAALRASLAGTTPGVSQVCGAAVAFGGTVPVPLALSAAPGNTVAALDWQAITSPLLGGYHVYRATSAGGPYTRITPTPLGAASFLDSGLANGTPYSYVVTSVAVDASESAFSNEATLSPQTTGPTTVGGTISANTTWTLAGSPYLVTSSLTLNTGTLTIQPGVEIRVSPGLIFTINTGRLLALGTAAAPIRFTSSTQPAVAGSWRSLDFNPTAQPSELRHVRIEGGGASGTVSLILDSPSLTAEAVSVGLRGATGISLVSTNAVLTGCVVEPANAIGVTISGGSPTLDGCTISGSSTQRGIAATSATTNLRIQSSTVSHGLELPFTDAGLVVSGNTFVNYPVGLGFRLHPNHVSQTLNLNTVQGLVPSTSVVTVLGGTLGVTSSWPGFVYVLESALTASTGASGSWTLLAGARVRVAAGTTVTINSGALRALGSAADRVFFTSVAQPAVAGSWRSLDFNPSAQPSELRHVRIEGGGGANTVSLILGSPSLTSEAVSVGARGAVGISLVTTSAVLIGCVVEPANAVGVTISGGSPTLDGCTISGSATQRGIVATAATSNLRIQNSSVSHGLELPFTDAGLVVSANTFVNYAVGLGFRLHPNHVSQTLNLNTVLGLVPGASVVSVLGGTLGVTSSWPGFVYVLESALTASTGASGSWTLLAGARVRVAAGTTVTINTGALQALGTAADRVFFTSVAQPTVAGSWRSLDFNPTAQPSELRHVRIEGGGTLGTVSLILGSPSLTAEAVSVGLRGSTGISLVSSNAVLTGCVVEPANAIGVTISGGSPTLDGCTISGSSTQRGIVATTTATTNLRIQNSIVSHGLELPLADAGLVVNGNTFVDYPIGLGFRLHPNHVSQTLNLNTVQGLVPSTSVVTVLGGTLGVSSSWPGFVYALESALTASTGAGGSWTLLAGARVRVAAGTTVTINSGALRALGSASDRVFFTSVAQPAVAGSWRSLDFNPTAQPSELRHVRIEGGGASGTVSLILGSTSLTAEAVSVGLRGSTGISLVSSNAVLTGCVVEPATAVGVTISGGSPTLDGCTISGSSTQRGIVATTATTSLRIQNSSVSHGLELPFTDAGLVVSGNTFVNYPVGLGFRLHPNHVSQTLNLNTVQGLVPSTSVVTVLGGTLGVTSTWSGLVYTLEASLTASTGAGGSWTLLAGSIVRLPSGASVTINTGALRALGSATDRVFFTSVTQPAVAASWRSLDFNPTAQPSELRHVRVEGGGSSGSASLILGSPTLSAEAVSVGARGAVGISLASSNAVLSGCVVEPANAVGVTISGSATLDGCTIAASSTQRGVSVAAGSQVQITNSAVTHGIVVASGDLDLRDSTVGQSGTHGLECTGTTGRVRATGATFSDNTSAGISCGARIVQIERNTISGSAVGIRITGIDPRLRVRNNNLAGNALALENLVSTAGVDARLNWWGSTSNPAALASGPALTNPWLAAAFAGPVAVLDAAALPLDFAPQTNSTTFSANFSETGSWALSVFDPGQTLVKSFAGAGAQLAQSWSGDDLGGAPLPAATYGYTLDVLTASGSAAPIRGELGLDPGLLSARIDSPQNLEYRLGGTIPVQGVASGAGLTSYVLSFAPGGAPADAAFTTIATATTPISGTIGSWNATSQTQGVYTLRLQANGPAGGSARAEALVRLVSATGTAATPFFSPNADGVLDLSSIGSQLSVDTPWTLRVRDAGSSVVRELHGDISEVATSWDGRDGGAVLQAEGAYSFQLVATAIAGQPVLATTPTTLDNTQPTALIDLPSEGAPVFSYDGVPITGTAQDLNLEQYELEAAPPGNPTAFSNFATVTSSVVAGALGTLPLGSAAAPAYPNGTVGLRLSVEDRAGNRATANRTVQIDQLQITNVSAAPTQIDPLLGQTALLYYNLDRPADVSIRMYRSASGGALSDTLLLAAPRAGGAHSESWDGRGASGDPLPATAYYFSIEATDASGRVAVYNQPSAPLLAGSESWSGVQWNGSASLSAAVFNPFRNDELRIDYTMSGAGLHSIDVRPLPCCAVASIPLRTLEPVPEGPTTIRWDGRLPSGAPLSQAFNVFFDYPRPIEANAIFVAYDFLFGEVRTNPYVFHPTLAEVTNLKYQLPRPAEVTVDVIDPDGNFLVTVQPTTLQPAGDYEVRWDGLDEDGLIVTTEGSYTLDLRARDLASNQVYVRRATTMVAR